MEKSRQRKLATTSRLAFLAIVGCCLSIISTGTSEASGSHCEIKVFSSGGKTDFSSLRRFFRVSDSILTRTIPTSSKTPKILYELVMTKNPVSLGLPVSLKRNKAVRIFMPLDTNPSQDQDDKICAAIGIALDVKAGVPLRDGNASAPRWLEMGILRKTRRQTRDNLVYGVVTFPGTHALLTLPHPPSLLKALESPLQPSDGPAYEILLEVCEVILDVTLRMPDGKEAILEMLALSAQGAPPRQAFEQALAPILQKSPGNAGKTVEEWLRESATTVCLNVFQPGTADFAARQFKNATMVEYRLKGKVEGDRSEKEGVMPTTQYCSIAKLQKIIDDVDEPEMLLKRKQLDLNRLACSLPSCLQKKVGNLARALDKLRDGDKKAFAAEAGIAIRRFNDELNRFCAMERFLLSCEKKFVPPSFRYNPALEQARISRSRRKKQWPGATSLLNRIEHDMSLK